MLNAQVSQFKLNNQGEILFQPSFNNPLPGEAVARLVKGQNPLQPEIEIFSANIPQDERAQSHALLEHWLKSHIVQVLEPLVALLENPEGTEIKEHVQDIIVTVFQAMGIVPREKIENLISALDADDRRILRAKKIKLGPILVFQPDLNKPAAVKLRALLWSLYNEKTLPPPVPNDGVVSVKVEIESADKEFYQAIGYPVMGSRAIRIDMLDRVISSVYDGAKDGKFKAQHQMAEWLGCGIEDLYAVLEAMGHKKIADEVLPEAAEPQIQENKTSEVMKPKPELACFFLKRGKAFEHKNKEKPERLKAYKLKKAEKHKSKPKPDKKEKRPERVMSAGPDRRLEDSPFAILGRLKDQSNAG